MSVMILELELPPELDERLRAEAVRTGQSVPVVAVRVLSEYVPSPIKAEGLAAILLRWNAEDAATSSTDSESFFTDLDAARSSDRPLYPAEKKGQTW